LLPKKKTFGKGKKKKKKKEGKKMAAPLTARRFFSSSSASMRNVAVLGASGGIGQPLSLLFKNSELVSNLHLYDVVNVPGVAADLSHISTPAVVKGFPKEQLGDALKGVDVVVIPAGVPRKPGMTRDDLFNTNASIVKNLAEAAAKYAPNAHLLIISNPVNSTVPIVAEVLKKHKVYDPRRLFGVTQLDVTRARTFVSTLKNVDVRKLSIPVVGGHAGITILPLLSQNNHGLTFTQEETEKLTHRIQFGGDEVVEAKAGSGSATLSMAYAGAEFAYSLLNALNGATNVTECAFVESNVTELPFFASKVTLGKNGVEKIHPVGKISSFEEQKLKELLPELKKSIEKGVQFAKSN